MTRVRLRVGYRLLGGPSGQPGQVLELPDDAAARLLSAGRAIRVDTDQAKDKPPARSNPPSPGQAEDRPKPKRRRPPAKAKPEAEAEQADAPDAQACEEPFLNPDQAPEIYDPLEGRASPHKRD